MSTEQAIEASKVPAVFMPMRILITRSVLWIKKIKSHSQLTYIPANFKNRLLIAIKNPLSPIGQIIELLNVYIYCVRTTQRFAHVCVCVCVCVCVSVCVCVCVACSQLENLRAIMFIIRRTNGRSEQGENETGQHRCQACERSEFTFVYMKEYLNRCIRHHQQIKR